MTKRHFLIIFILCIGIVNIPKLFLKDTNHKEHDDHEAPFEHFALIRSFPDASLDMAAFNQMLNYATFDFSQAKSSSTLSWQQEGPTNIGGRITCLKIHPTNQNIIFAGCPGGGLFKTTNAGATWIPVFDDQPFLSISCITFDPTNPSIMYVGTGDPDIPFTSLIGNGVYKSTDGGISWNNIGLNQQGIITQILVNPLNTNMIYASAMGTPMVRDFNRGIYKTTNGGSSWNQILSIDNQTGVSDMMMDFTNPNIIYASAWSRIRTNTESMGFSNSSRIYKTTNGGNAWNILSNGLPNTKLARFGICMSKQNANKIYVSVCDSTYNLENIYVSTNGGALFTALPGSANASGLYSGFGWYFGKITVNPSNDNEILIAGVEHYKSSDGGNSFALNQPPWWNYNPHADIHDIQFKSSSNYIIATDGGLYETFDDGGNWYKLDDIPNTQFYKVNYNPFNSNEYLGGAQDNGTMSGGLTSGVNNWIRIFGGDGFQPRIDNTDSQIMYAETQNGGLYVSMDAGSSFNGFSNFIDGNDRRNWDMPYVFGGNSNSIMYTGTYRVYKNTQNPFEDWTPISGDLTDGIIYAERFHNISCVDNSSLNSNYIYAGTSDGNVWRSLDDGNTWDSLQMTLPYRYVTSVHSSPNVLNNVYVTHSGYRYNQYIPHIHKSINNGTSWIDISGDLPQAGINDMVVLPGNENILFVATDIGVYYTINSGINWMRLGNNMPIMVIWDLEYNPNTNKLIAGTYARGIQTIDVTSLMTSVGIKNTTLIQSSVSIFPNPAVNEINIKASEKIKTISIIDQQGKVITNTTTQKINIENLARGVYNIVIETEKGKITKRFIKN
ncbi:MAG: T9SS type A sorting domain-containing protein [Bacteroidia bacterium]|nr:T9SS type A sorting domain-containing protein [Bacteroidia bacterium]